MHAQCGSLRCAQETILYGLLGISGVVLLIPYITGVLAAGRLGIWSIVVTDTLAYLWLLYLVFKPSLPYRRRVYGLLLLLEFLAMSLLIITGSAGAGWLWLFLPPVLATLLLDCRAGYVTIAVSLVLLTVSAMVDVLFVPGTVALVDDGLTLFIVVSSNYMALSVILVFIIGRLLNNLENSLQALQKGTQELLLTQEATVDTMASLAEYRDVETGNHIIRTRRYVRLLARQLQQQSSKHAKVLDDEAIELISQSAPLHDIGKIGVPDKILLKPGRLTPDEFEQMKKHTDYGREALMHAEEKLGSSHFLGMAAEIAWSHHEKWDGSGYPRGLSGESIPLAGRIMAVADVYDALISERVYKKAFSHEEALAYIEDNSGRHFDPEIVRAVKQVAVDFQAIALQFADH